MRTFTNGIVANRPAERNPLLMRAGAGSFTRLLGCAPQVIARIRPSLGAPGATHRPCPGTGIVMPDGPMRGAHHPRRARTQRDLHLDSALGWNRTSPTDAGRDTEADHVGFTKGIGLWWDAQPN